MPLFVISFEYLAKPSAHPWHTRHICRNLPFVWGFDRPLMDCCPILLFSNLPSALQVNFSTVNLLLNSYFVLPVFYLKISKMCDTIVTFNLIIANIHLKMRPRPAAHPHQQEKKTRKYYIYMWCFNSRETIKNDAIKLIFSPIDFFCWG